MRKRITACALWLAAILSTVAAAGNPVVEMDTNHGLITIELHVEEAPVSAGNFLEYVADKHYDGMIFHRVVSGFVIQGGGYAIPESPGGMPSHVPTRDPIENDARSSGLSNQRGTIAMARTAKPDTATSQFFINLVDNSRTLDAGGVGGPDGWAVFGRVTGGMDVVDAIAAVETHRSRMIPPGRSQPATYTGVPVEPVVIESIRLKSVTATSRAVADSDHAGTNDEPGALPDPLEAEDVMKSLRFYDSGDGVVVDIDFGETGTTEPLALEWSEDLQNWKRATEVEEFPAGTNGVQTVALPEGRSMLFVRLIRLRQTP